MTGGKTKEKPTVFTRKFVMESWGLAYYGGGVFFRDPAWRLSEDEAADLTERTMDLLQSIDPEALKKFEKKWGKYVPAFSLLTGIASITYGRVVHTIQLRKAERAESVQGQRRGRGRGPDATGAAPASVSEDANGAPHGDGSGDEQAPAQGGKDTSKAPSTLRSRGSTDWTDLVGRDD